MKAMVLDEFGSDFVLTDIPKPQAGPGEVVVKIVACGVGLTLEHARNGLLGGSTPRILGHELAGVVDEIGPGVEHWEIGARVTSSFYLFCGQCYRCAEGRESLCINNKGYYGIASNGAFAEYAALPARNLVRVPDGVPLDSAGITADALATPYHVADKRARIKPGENVAVIGAGGGIGVHMLQIVRAFGGRAIAVERDAEKLAELRRRNMADAYVDAGEDSWATALRAEAADRLDVCIDIVANEGTLKGAIDALGFGGRLVIVGFNVKADLRASSSRVLQEELEILGSRYASRAEIAACLELAAQGKIAPLVGARFPLTELNEAFEEIRANSVFGRILIQVGDER